ncbi:hypothetical protein AH6C_048 [Aeromonas phage pAh6-C]|uniref:Uncharacterized protein n=1 Tax=Aeromonas phage pAh6-C TaxID=1505227 RepID=A0A076G5M3_9CAUD|nr:hypothetical protein AH6C_048 [Aeromonas phage pAh6-C]AII26802.1 hypothetical protein AH6C_048 [Aeromonas phage pAh6-C]
MINSFILVLLINYTNTTITVPETYRDGELCEKSGKVAMEMNGKVKGFWCLQVPTPEKR